MRLNQPIVGHGADDRPERATGSSRRDGGVFCFGDARFYGSTGALRLNSPMLGHDADVDREGLLAVRA